ncbi:MAG TPA: hypothetical protein ENK55_07310 [Actinobacteria bacterium]|nr:hypothetical protein [Actinomycetota bacterium]
MNRGSSLLEVLVVGTATVLLVVQAVVAMGRLSAAGGLAEDAARQAAFVAARTGSVDAARRAALVAAPGADVEVTVEDGEALATVRIDVPVVGPEAAAVHLRVTGRATAAISPHRSRR